MGMSFPAAEGQPTTPRMLTAEETQVLLWLHAEREWQAEQWRAQAGRNRDRKEAQLEVSARAEYRRIVADHATLIAGATGLRRALLVRHEPVFDRRFDRSYEGRAVVECRVCYAGQDHNHDFPCDDYELARDWDGTP